MKPNRIALCFAGLALALLLCTGLSVMAQEPEKPLEGINSGIYNIKQTAEFGWRFADVSGNQDVYNTFVFLRDGPRLLDYSLEMRSLNHEGWLFDNLFVSNFGYGGDPNNVTRLRMYKNKWYNFSGIFRRDYNAWNYGLLANPLNLASPTFANAPVGFDQRILFSPHAMSLVRRMSDYQLTLLPQSKIRFRLGYNRNINEGPSLTSTHYGTDALFFQQWKTTVNSYQAGVDIKVLPKTNISYDQFLLYYKADTSQFLAETPFVLTNGTPVDLGLPFNPAGNQPCAGPFNVPPNAGTAYAGCNGYLGYTRFAQPRNSIPTEQVSFQSNYFKNVDLSGRVSYSATDVEDLGFNEFFDGSITRTRQRQLFASGPINNRRVSFSADGGITVHINDKLSFTDSFRASNFQIPGNFAFLNLNLFARAPLLPSAPPPASQTSLTAPDLRLPPGVFDATNCPPPFTAASCPQHNTSSAADVDTGVVNSFLKQNINYNTFEIEYNFTKHYGIRVGYRFVHRSEAESNSTDYTGTNAGEFYFPGSGASVANRGDCTLASGALPPGCTAVGNGAFVWSGTKGDTELNFEEINEHSALFGFWMRPTNEFRMSYDVELMSADDAFTRISPRQLQHYKFRMIYNPVNWIHFAGSINILERRNNVTDIFHTDHSRSAGFDILLEPNDRFVTDFGFDYSGISSSTQICYALSSAPPVGASNRCPVVSGGSPPIVGISVYTNRQYFGHGDIRWKPIKHLTTNFGLAVTKTIGQTTFLSPNAPAGSLQYEYYRPYAGVAYELYNGLFWKTSWGFYDYVEPSGPDPFTNQRNFRGNLWTIGMRYSF